MASTFNSVSGEQKCNLCKRPKAVPGQTYCVFHEAAYDEIRIKFQDWKSAYGQITWERYLETITRLKETGDWTKEVATLELRRFKSENQA
jgi:hypothetical protein